MDQNKLIKLKEIGYSFASICALCEHSSFPKNEWGTCESHMYVHKKHREFRNLSIHKFGGCSSFARRMDLSIKSFEDYIKGET